MNKNEYVKIFSGSFIIVQMIMERLQETGIIGIVKDESESARMAGFGPSIPGFQELYVSNEELDRALPIVESAQAELDL